MTQGRQLITALKRQGMTALQLNLLRISTSPLKRIAECLDYEREVLVKNKNRKGIIVYRVRNVKP